VEFWDLKIFLTLPKVKGLMEIFEIYNICLGFIVLFCIDIYGMFLGFMGLFLRFLRFFWDLLDKCTRFSQVIYPSKIILQLAWYSWMHKKNL